MNYLRLAGTTLDRPVTNELDGTIGGTHTEHWDDHVDAKVFARPQVRIPEHGLLMPGYGLLVPGDTIGFRNGKPVKVISGGAMASGLYVDNFIDVLDATQLAIDLSLTSHKIALFTNALTPDFSANVDFTAAPYTSNEASGTGYTAGGQVIVGPTVTESPAGSLMYDMNDQVWAAPTTVTSVRGAVEYADALAGNNLIFAVTFGADYTSTAGTFTIQWASTGCWAIDLVP